MKRKIRRDYLRRRKDLSRDEWREKSILIQERILSGSFYKDARSLLVYAHFDREVMTDLIIGDALSSGKVLCLPFNDMEKRTIIPSVLSSPEEIDRKGSIPGPSFLRPFPAGDLDLVLLPGVAYDVHGNRIGMGGGFFDRFLKKVNSGIIRTALAFDFQVVEGFLPFDEWDEKVVMIVTEKRIIKVQV